MIFYFYRIILRCIQSKVFRIQDVLRISNEAGDTMGKTDNLILLFSFFSLTNYLYLKKFMDLFFWIKRIPAKANKVYFLNLSYSTRFGSIYT